MRYCCMSLRITNNIRDIQCHWNEQLSELPVWRKTRMATLQRYLQTSLTLHTQLLCISVVPFSCVSQVKQKLMFTKNTSLRVCEDLFVSDCLCPDKCVSSGQSRNGTLFSNEEEWATDPCINKDKSLQSGPVKEASVNGYVLCGSIGTVSRKRDESVKVGTVLVMVDGDRVGDEVDDEDTGMLVWIPCVTTC